MLQQQMQDGMPRSRRPRREHRAAMAAAATSATGTTTGDILDLVGQRWTLQIIRDIGAGLSRFNQLQASLGLSRALLTARLRDLVTEGVIEMAPLRGGKARQHYVLTPRGRALCRAILLMQE